jgi:hypothetical protein
LSGKDAFLLLIIISIVKIKKSNNNKSIGRMNIFRARAKSKDSERMPDHSWCMMERI